MPRPTLVVEETRNCDFNGPDSVDSVDAVVIFGEDEASCLYMGVCADGKTTIITSPFGSGSLTLD